MRRGFTLLEIAAVISTILLLAALMQPALSSAQHRARIESSLARLRQLSNVVNVYRLDYDPDGGPVWASLPSYGVVYSTYLGLGEESFHSPCGYSGAEANLCRIGYHYAYLDDDAVREFFEMRGERSVIFTDPNCNRDPIVWHSIIEPKLGLGVQLDGRLLRLKKYGFPGELSWWIP